MAHAVPNDPVFSGKAHLSIVPLLSNHTFTVCALFSLRERVFQEIVESFRALRRNPGILGNLYFWILTCFLTYPNLWLTWVSNRTEIQFFSCKGSGTSPAAWDLYPCQLEINSNNWKQTRIIKKELKLNINAQAKISLRSFMASGHDFC